MKDDEQKDKITVCKQYCVIGPADLIGSLSMQSILSVLDEQYFFQQNCISFIEQNLAKLGFTNARLLYRIKTSYFWNGAASHMIKCMKQDSWLLNATILTLISKKNATIRITKYQAYLILCHMFMGTFPPQLYEHDLSFGKLMTVNEDEDEVTSQAKLQFRANKLKSIVRYFCVYYKRQQQQQKAKDGQGIIFQRHRVADPNLKDDSISLVSVQFKIGEYFRDDNEINSISMNQCSSGRPGSRIYEDQNLDLQEKIFMSHPEMHILRVVLCDPLEKDEALLIHGAEKYSHLDSVSPYACFNFGERYKDASFFNPVLDMRTTSFLMYHRRKTNYWKDLLEDARKIHSGLIGSQLLYSKSQRLVSGKFKAGGKEKYEMQWDLRFIVQWIAVSSAGWQNFEYYVDDKIELSNLRILTHELKDYAVQDILSVISSFYDFRHRCRAKISLLNYFKDFAL